MRRSLILLAVILVGLGSDSFGQATDKEFVRIPLENYIKGHATVDVEYTKKAFYPEGYSFSVTDGKYVATSVTDYINSLVGRKPAQDEAKRKRFIESVDISGNAAMAKVVSDYPSVKYVDYMAMLKIGGEWKIVNKVYFIDTKTAGSKVTDPVSEAAAARLPLENYLKGHATGDGQFHKKAFHTEGNLIFIRDGKYTTRLFAEYIAGSSGKPAADEDKRRRWIESIDISGNAAVGKIILDYPTTRFVDYMSLLKINGEWKIVNKLFYAEPKKPAETK